MNHITKYKCLFSCSSGTYSFFKEYISSLLENIPNSTLYLDSSIPTREILNSEEKGEEKYVIFSLQIWYPWLDILKDCKHCKIYILNTEQLSITAQKDKFVKIFNDGYSITDYSLENIKILQNLVNKDKNHKKLRYVPYQYSDIENINLKNIITNYPATKKYDIAFVGAESARRNNILNALKLAGFSIIIANGFDNHRDLQISEAKILLNIHYANDYQIYESIRCDRWAFAGHVVVSESSLFTDSLDMNPIVQFFEYEQLVSKTIEILQNYEKFKVERDKQHLIYFPTIKNNRLNILKDSFSELFQ